MFFVYQLPNGTDSDHDQRKCSREKLGRKILRSMPLTGLKGWMKFLTQARGESCMPSKIRGVLSFQDSLAITNGLGIHDMITTTQFSNIG